MRKYLRGPVLGMASVTALACTMLATSAQAVTAPSDGPIEGSNTYRLAGADRYETAIKVSQQWYATSKTERPRTVFVASGQNFPDALAAAPIAGMNRAPLLLTPTGSLPDNVKAEIERLKPKRIVVVGGPSAVSDAVKAKLDLLAKTVRVSGADRYETARAVIRYGMLDSPDFATVSKDKTTGDYKLEGLTAGFLGTGTDGKSHDVTAGVPQLRFYLATGRDFPDALSIGAVGGNWLGAYPGPVFLEDGLGTSMSQQTVSLMADILSVWGPDKDGLDAYVIGGEGAMIPALFKSVQAGVAKAAADSGKAGLEAGKVIRIGGADRYQTSQMIVDKLKKVYSQQSTPFPDPQQAVLATGVNFPDALAGSAYAGASNSALWVVPPTCVPDAVFVTANKLKLTHYALLGGTGALAAPVDALAGCP